MPAKIDKVSLITSLTLAFGSCFASRAHAQQASASAATGGGLQEIVVTATKTGRTLLQDTPLAISAVTAGQFDRTGGRDIRDLQLYSPSLTIAQNGSSAEPYIRGVGSNNTFPGSDSSVALYIDGVYIGRSSSFFQDLFDIDRIEVLRGPQGTLYGRNATGGAISVITRQPTDTLEADARITAGDYDLRRVEGYLSGPLVADKIDASLSARYSTRDGYFQNIAPGGVPADSENDRSVRAQVKITPTERLKVLVRGDYLNSHSTIGSGIKVVTPTSYDPIANSTIGRPFTIATNTAPLVHEVDYGESAEIDYTFSNAAKLTSLTAYRASDLRSRLDSDFSAASIRYTDIKVNQHQTSEDLNLSGHLARLTYITGIDYIQEDVGSIVAVSTFPGTRTEYVPPLTEHSIAGFAQGTYDITSTLQLTAGIRYTSERKTFDQFIGTESVVVAAYPPLTVGPFRAPPVRYAARRTDEAATPKLGLNYRPAAGVLLYASVAKGFKSGGFSLTSANSFQGFSPETLWDYELGLKTEFDDHRALVNVDGFHYNYTNLQVQSFIVPGVLDITNAASAHINGVELETEYKPIPGLTLGGALTYLDAKYSNFPDAIGPGNVAFSATGHYLDSAPKTAFNLNAGYEHRIAGNLTGFGHLDYMWRGQQYFTPKNDVAESQAAYGVLDAEIGIRIPNRGLEISLYGHNLQNTAYYTSTATIGGVTFGTLAAPRTFGVQITGRY